MFVREAVSAFDIVAGRSRFIKLLESFLSHSLGIHVEPILTFLDMGTRGASLFEYSLYRKRTARWLVNKYYFWKHEVVSYSRDSVH